MNLPRLLSRRIFLSTFAATIALSVATAALAANADGKTASTAIPLNNVVSGNLVGSTAGAFAYYTFNYPGDGSTGTLTLSITPSDPVTEGFLGINVYQAGLQIASENVVGTTPGVRSVTFATTTAGPVLVQVWNYGAGLSASYQLQLSGVNQNATPVVAQPTASPAPPAFGQAPTSNAPSGDGSAANPFPLSGSLTGILPGNASGNFVYFTVPSTGDGSIQTIQFDFTPGGADVGTGVFVNVYQNGVQLSAVHATNNNGNPPGVVPVTYSSTVAGPVLIQVGNYNPSTTISYTISH
jgi:hypothetical protein